MENAEENIILKIEQDELLQCFLNAGGSKSAVLNTLSISDQLKKLGDAIDLISSELQKQVLDKHNDLLQQAKHATKLEEVLDIMNTRVQNLFANAERLKTQITIPYIELQKHTLVLSRLHLAGHILRQVNRLQLLTKRLMNTNDPVQKASILQELENLASDPEIKDIDAVTMELRNIRTQQQKVVQLANGSLNYGVINENITQTTTALQIFCNLGTITATTDSFVDNCLHECQESWASLFIMNVNTSVNKTKGGPGHVNFGSTQGFRAKLSAELEKVFAEDIHQICKRVKFLQHTMNNMNVANINIEVASKFWDRLGTLLQDGIKKSSSTVQTILEEDYPKLLKCYYELTTKLNYPPFKLDRNVLKNLENSYLSKSLTRMLDPAQAMFVNENSIPSHDNIDSLIRIITSELSVALVEENLSEQIAKNVAKCIKMVAVKTEQQLETGPDAAQVVGGSPNAGQQKNVNLANSLYYLQMQIQRMISNMKDSLTDICVYNINDSLKYLDNLTAAILQPLIDSVTSIIETIIVTIHLESDWSKLAVPSNKNYNSCSPYMRELNQFITRVYHTYLQHFENKEVLASKCNEICTRTIEMFVRHTSLLRPISYGGRYRLQSDYQHLENSLKLICPHLADLGRPYRLFKSMASLIIQTPEVIVASQMAGSSVPPSTILMMLFAYASPDLASPHQNTSWSLPKLSVWMDEHVKESDRLDLVAGALQKYESIVRQKNSTNYDPVYPVMAQFLETVVSQVNN